MLSPSVLPSCVFTVLVVGVCIVIAVAVFITIMITTRITRTSTTSTVGALLVNSRSEKRYHQYQQNHGCKK